MKLSFQHRRRKREIGAQSRMQILRRNRILGFEKCKCVTRTDFRSFQKPNKRGLSYNMELIVRKKIGFQDLGMFNQAPLVRKHAWGYFKS